MAPRRNPGYPQQLKRISLPPHSPPSPPPPPPHSPGQRQRACPRHYTKTAYYACQDLHHKREPIVDRLDCRSLIADSNPTRPSCPDSRSAHCAGIDTSSNQLSGIDQLAHMEKTRHA
ncbi:hypothetical protein P3342_001103 [Pyrenophora teres f. teres]|nr:hypothetical protein P3342_001103 [Pyrenophora teres f. teres]